MVAPFRPILPPGGTFHGHAIHERLIDACRAPLQAFAAATEDGRTVRIYCLEATSVTPAIRARFAARLQQVQRIAHERIPRILDGGLDERLFWASVEALEGQSLSDRVASEGPLDPMHVVMMLRDAVGPLRVARDAGALHGRLAPRYLLTTAAECRAVLEIGFDLLFGPGEDGSDIVYRAPEQLDPSRRADERADIYALGASAYFALGATPFEDEDGAFDLEQIRRRILNDPLPPISRVRAGCPPELDHLLRSMCAKRVEDRPRSLEILEEMLTGALAACVARRKGKGSYPLPPEPEAEGPKEPSPPPPAETPPPPVPGDDRTSHRSVLRSAAGAALIGGSIAILVSAVAVPQALRQALPIIATATFSVPAPQPTEIAPVIAPPAPAPPPPRAVEPPPKVTSPERRPHASANQRQAEPVAPRRSAIEVRARSMLYRKERP
jgi:hypothetical protein